MRRINMTDSDYEHWRDWQRLPEESKEALTKILKLLGNEEKRKSFYYLIETQHKIAKIVLLQDHMTWVGNLIVRIAVIATTILTAIILYTNYVKGWIGK